MIGAFILTPDNTCIACTPSEREKTENTWSSIPTVGLPDRACRSQT